MKKVIIPFLLLLLCAISCKKITDSASSLGKDDVKIEDLKEIKVNDLYALSIPNYMTELKSLHDEASFKYANVFKETYTIVIDESKEEFINTFVDLELYDNEKTALENYSDFQIQSLTENIIDLEIEEIELKIKKVASKQYEFHGIVDDLDIAYLISFIEGKDTMFMVMSWTLEERFKKYENMFKLVQGSFKLLN